LHEALTAPTFVDRVARSRPHCLILTQAVR
jgi:hypothetical protein